MAEAILGESFAGSSAATIWERIETVSNTDPNLSIAIPSSTSSYALIYAICNLNTTYSPGYDATREAVIFASSPTVVVHTFVNFSWGQTAFEPFQYISPVLSHATALSGSIFIFGDARWSVGYTPFFGIRALVNSWSVCAGVIGQISATFYGIKEFS